MFHCKSIDHSVLKADIASATDVAVTAIARECIRMRYVDFACESLCSMID
jgi:hypothetical protein